MKSSRPITVAAGVVLCAAIAGAVVAWAAGLGRDAAHSDRSESANRSAVITNDVDGSTLHSPSNVARVTNSDWPNLFGPTHNSLSPETGLQFDWPPSGPPVRWRYKVGAGYSTPVVAGGSVVVFHRVGDEERIEYLCADDGRPIWSANALTSYKCKFEYSNGPYSTPVISDGRVYAWGAEGLLRCVELADGRDVWQRNLLSDYDVKRGDFGVASSPLVDGDRLILNVGGSKVGAGIVALDKRTGETLWTATHETASHSTPCPATIHGQRLVFVLTELNLVALASETGRVLWSVPFHARVRDLGKVNATSPVVSGDLVFVTAYQVGCLCLRVLPDGKYEEVWRGGPRVLDSQYTNLVVSEGYVYGSAVLDKSIRCLRLSDGELMWKWPGTLGRGVSMLAADRRLILFGELGQLATLPLGASEPQNMLVTEPLLETPCYSAPVLADGRLLLRNEREIVCYELRR